MSQTTERPPNHFRCMERIDLDQDFKDWVILNLPLQVIIDMHDLYCAQDQVFLFTYGKPMPKTKITTKEIEALEEFIKNHL
jgi:hypothetical protein